MSASLPSWAVRGAKVVCIFDDWEQLPGLPPIPARQPMLNEVLTIREVMTTDHFNAAQHLLLYIGQMRCLLSFEELGHGWLYLSHRFRPLVSTKTEAEDVALIKSLIDLHHPVAA